MLAKMASFRQSAAKRFAENFSARHGLEKLYRGKCGGSLTGLAGRRQVRRGGMLRTCVTGDLLTPYRLRVR